MRAPRPYQKKDATAILACLQRGRNPLYVLPTGGGKTWGFCYVTSYVVQHAGWHVGVFVHRRELLRQASASLAAAGVPHGVIAPGHGLTSHTVHVASIDTVLARLSAGCRDTAAWLARLNMAVLDEAHHAVAGKWLRLAQAMAKALLFGATATPYRTDGQGLGDVFNEAVRGPSVQALIDDGWLTPFWVKSPPTSLDFSKVKKRGGDYVQSDLQKMMDSNDLSLPAIRLYSRWCPGVPAIGFCDGIERAAYFAERFSAAGWLSTSVDGGMSERDRDASIVGLGNGRLQALMSCEIISEGTDIPVVSAAIFQCATQSTPRYQQQAGRAGRPVWPRGFDPNAATADERKAAMATSGKPFAYILDLVGNVATHGMPEADRPWTLQGGIKGMERQVTATRRCRHCWTVHAIADSCPRCGAAYPKIAAKMHPGAPSLHALSVMGGVSGFTAEQIASMKLADVLKIAKTESDIRNVAKIRGYKDSWVGFVLNERRTGQRAGGRR